MVREVQIYHWNLPLISVWLIEVHMNSRLLLRPKQDTSKQHSSLAFLPGSFTGPWLSR